MKNAQNKEREKSDWLSGSEGVAFDIRTDTQRLKPQSRFRPVSYPYAELHPSPAEADTLLHRQDNRLEISDHLDLDFPAEFGKDVRQGLSKSQKAIPAKYFYDECGSRLFEQICRLPEYYPTRTEISILEKYAPRIMSFFADGQADLVEIGCGSDLKVRKLLDGVEPKLIAHIRYVPVDISGECLRTSARRLLRDYRALRIRGIIADFTRHLERLPPGRKLIVFLGGTFGNFTESQGLRLLKRFAEIMNPEDRLLLGLDMVKPVAVLEAAYNDSAGVTAMFNLNILNHVNRCLKAEFDTADFVHRAFYNKEQERIEMHLAAKKNLQVRIVDLDMCLRMEKSETIHTEISKKFSRRSATKLFLQAGLFPAAWHSDRKGWFSLVDLRTGLAG